MLYAGVYGCSRVLLFGVGCLLSLLLVVCLLLFGVVCVWLFVVVVCCLCVVC